MSEFGKYPSPDFGCPASEASTQSNGASLIRPPTFQNRTSSTSSFQPSMWNWYEPPASNPWVFSCQAQDPNWYGGAGSPYGYGEHGSNRPNGINFHHGGGWHRGGHRGGREHYGARNKQVKPQRQRKEPEFTHFCDTCDKGFKNKDKFDEHMSQHVKCSVPDCSFTAHKKIVSIHWKNNHAPGAKRIKLDTADEIERWREERRKNYPTLQNVEKKSKMKASREERGEVLETAQFGRMHRGRGRGQRGGRFQRGRWSGRGDPHHQQPHHHQARDGSEKTTPLPKPHWDGDPLGALANSDPDSDREEPAGGDSKQGSLTVAPKQMTSGLGALIASYGSMTDSDSDDQPEAVPIQRGNKYLEENQELLKTISPKPQEGALSLGKRSWVEDSQQEPQTHPASFSPGWERERGGRGRRGGRGGRGRRGRRQNTDTPQQRRATLLEMLLAPDIRHERNVLLQCVRYIVQNNFFGLEANACDQKRNKGTAVATTVEESKQTQEITLDETMGSAVSVCGQEVNLDQTSQEPKPLNQGLSDTTIGQGSTPLLTVNVPQTCVTVCTTRTGVDDDMPSEAKGVQNTAGAESDRGLITKAEEGMLHRTAEGSLLEENTVRSIIQVEGVLTPASKESTPFHVNNLVSPNRDDVDALLPEGLEQKALPTAYVYDDEVWEIPGENIEALL